MDLPRLVVNPERICRAESRVRECPPKQFPVMKKQRAKWKLNLLKQQIAG